MRHWLWFGALLGITLAACPLRATSRRMTLDLVIRDRLPMAIVRVERVEKLSGVQMALARVERGIDRIEKGKRIAFQAQRVTEWNESSKRVRPGDRFWLVQGFDWPREGTIGLRIPSADAVRDEVARKWGREVPLYEAATRQVWRFDHADWVSEPYFSMPSAIRSQKKGKRSWYHLDDIEDYIRRGLIEDPTLVRLVEGSRLLAVGVMRRLSDNGVELRIDRVLAKTDGATVPNVGDVMTFQESPLWGYDVRYDQPMLWFLQYQGNGFGFVGVEGQERVLRIIRRRKTWRELKPQGPP